MNASNISLSASLVAALGSAAGAQPHEDTEVPVATDGVEVSIASTYLQATGGHGDTGPGFGGEITLGVRLTDNLTLSGYGSLAGFSEGADNEDVAVGALGLKADWHFLPRRLMDPWISLGAGVKELWGGHHDMLDRQLLGIELARFQAGVDYRIAPGVSIGPSASVGATMFTHEKTSSMDDYTAIDDKDVELVVTVGLVGRFGFGPTR